MPVIVDRRLNPKGKHLGDRRRLLRRARSEVKRAVKQMIEGKPIEDFGTHGEKISIPKKGLSRPTYRRDPDTGEYENVLTGNDWFVRGDKVEKSKTGGGGRGKEGATDGEGEDDFTFVILPEEFLDMFFEDMELPDMIKRSLKHAVLHMLHRAGYSVTGTPANLNLVRTMRNALGRRIALKRPHSEEIKKIEEEIFALENTENRSDEEHERLLALYEIYERLFRQQKRIPYLDPLDVRYNYFQPRPEPNTNAVMFCLMDVSVSMGEREKDLAKRFFILLYLFLKRHYERIDLVFIRHTHNAKEVDEETFFYGRESGGTVVSTALREMKKIIDARYPPSEWNIYAAQASDGENSKGDSALCATILRNDLLPICQYFAYIEILAENEEAMMHNDENGPDLWKQYRSLGPSSERPNFAMKRVAKPKHVYPALQRLFAKQRTGGGKR